MYSNKLNSLLIRMYNNSSYKLDKKTVDIFELKKMLANKHIRPEGDFFILTDDGCAYVEQLQKSDSVERKDNVFQWINLLISIGAFVISIISLIVSCA